MPVKIMYRICRRRSWDCTVGYRTGSTRAVLVLCESCGETGYRCASLYPFSSWRRNGRRDLMAARGRFRAICILIGMLGLS